MHSLARTSLGLLALALITPITAQAQDVSPSAPAGYLPEAPASASSTASPPVGLDGKPMPAAPVEPPHKHKGRVLCAKCAAKHANATPPGRFVACAHSKNGICTACQAALEGPGQWGVAGGPAPAVEAPGRAVVSSGPAGARAGMGGSSVAYDAAAGDPVPVGVIQANFSQSNPVGTTSTLAPQASQPGRAVAESSAGHDPYQAKSGSFPRPHILGHLFGWSLMGADRAEERARRKAEAHAMIAYDNDGKSSTPVEDVPASVVYGKKR